MKYLHPVLLISHDGSSSNRRSSLALLKSHADVNKDSQVDWQGSTLPPSAGECDAEGWIDSSSVCEQLHPELKMVHCGTETTVSHNIQRNLQNPPMAGREMLLFLQSQANSEKLTLTYYSNFLLNKRRIKILPHER